MGIIYHTWIDITFCFLETTNFIQKYSKIEEISDVKHIEFDSPEKDYLLEEIDNYGIHILYEKNIFKCSDKDKQMILDSCKSLKINFDDLIEVYRSMNGSYGEISPYLRSK